jgi:putative transposase
MGRVRFLPEQIIGKLREAEVLIGQGLAIGEICRKIAISEQTYYRWREDYGGMRIDQARRLKEHVDVRTLFIEPGSPWENGYVESFNGKLRDELLNGEIFDTLLEARVVIENWRRAYNQIRPHSSLGYRPPAPEVLEPRIFTSQVVS